MITVLIAPGPALKVDIQGSLPEGHNMESLKEASTKQHEFRLSIATGWASDNGKGGSAIPQG